VIRAVCSKLDTDRSVLLGLYVCHTLMSVSVHTNCLHVVMNTRSSLETGRNEPAGQLNSINVFRGTVSFRKSKKMCNKESQNFQRAICSFFINNLSL